MLFTLLSTTVTTVSFFLGNIIGLVEDIFILNGIFSVAFKRVNSPINGVVTFLSVKQLFKQDVILTLVFSAIAESTFASNNPFSSADAVKLLLSYSILTFAYGMVCPDITFVESVIG